MSSMVARYLFFRSDAFSIVHTSFSCITDLPRSILPFLFHSLSMREREEAKVTERRTSTTTTTIGWPALMVRFTFVVIDYFLVNFFTMLFRTVAYLLFQKSFNTITQSCQRGPHSQWVTERRIMFFRAFRLHLSNLWKF